MPHAHPVHAPRVNHATERHALLKRAGIYPLAWKLTLTRTTISKPRRRSRRESARLCAFDSSTPTAGRATLTATRGVADGGVADGGAQEAAAVMDRVARASGAGPSREPADGSEAPEGSNKSNNQPSGTSAHGSGRPSPPWRPDDKDGHLVYELGESLTPRCTCPRRLTASRLPCGRRLRAVVSGVAAKQRPVGG